MDREQFFSIQLQVMIEELGEQRTNQLVEDMLRQSITFAKVLKALKNRPKEGSHLRLVEVGVVVPD